MKSSSPIVYARPQEYCKSPKGGECDDPVARLEHASRSSQETPRISSPSTALPQDKRSHISPSYLQAICYCAAADHIGMRLRSSADFRVCSDPLEEKMRPPGKHDLGLSPRSRRNAKGAFAHRLAS